MSTKSAQYKNLLTDIENIIDDSVPTFTNLGNITATKKELERISNLKNTTLMVLHLVLIIIVKILKVTIILIFK